LGCSTPDCRLHSDWTTSSTDPNYLGASSNLFVLLSIGCQIDEKFLPPSRSGTEGLSTANCNKLNSSNPPVKTFAQRSAPVTLASSYKQTSSESQHPQPPTIRFSSIRLHVALSCRPHWSFPTNFSLPRKPPAKPSLCSQQNFFSLKFQRCLPWRDALNLQWKEETKVFLPAASDK